MPPEHRGTARSEGQAQPVFAVCREQKRKERERTEKPSCQGRAHRRWLTRLVMEKLSLAEVPRELIKEISEDLSDFLIGFVRVRDTATGQDAELAGSGTLIQVDDTYGILTAHHVMECLQRTGEIGLVLATRFGTEAHRYTIREEVIRWVKIARGRVDSEGPDLGMLILPPAEVGGLKALKSFYNLSLRREQILSNPPHCNEGIWFLCGFAGELTAKKPPEAGFAHVKGFRGMCGAGGVKRQYSVGDFDYCDFEVGYGGISEPPESFGGFSGGGLWQVPLMRGANGELQAKERILSGVAFYQADRTGDRRIIKCHGYRSVYGRVMNCVYDITS